MQTQQNKSDKEAWGTALEILERINRKIHEKESLNSNLVVRGENE